MLTHAHDTLPPNNCFSLRAPRCGDTRVRARWLSGGTGPKPGQYGEANLRTCLGSASCAQRVGGAGLRADRAQYPCA